MDYNKINESLARATKGLMFAEPFYGLYLMQINKEWDDRIHTSGVGKHGINIKMKVSPLFWESLKYLWQMMILKHNVLNVVFHHIEMFSSLPDKEVASIASNIVCNQYINEGWLPMFDVLYKDYVALNSELFQMLKDDLKSGAKTEEEVVAEMRKIPPRGVYLQDFPELNLEPLKGLKYYYDKLLQAKNKQPGKGGSQALNDLIANYKAGLDEGWYKDWKEFEGMTEAEKKLLGSQIDYQLKDVAEQIKKSRGTVPGELAGYIDALDRKDPPKFNWRAYMRRFIGGSEKVEILRTRAKPNLRYPHNPGRRIRSKAHVLIGVDTSGSMSDFEIKELFHEVYHMQKMGSDITVVQFDHGIQNVKNYKKGLEDSIKVFGRGGTSFDHIVDYANEHGGKFACMVVFTDGCAPAPSNKPKVPCLWVHSSTSNINEDLPGQRIKLEF